MEEQTTTKTGLMLRGIATLLFGVAAVFWPGITLVTLVYLFSAFVLVYGVIDLVTGIGALFHSDKSVLSRILGIVVGVLFVGVGVYLIRHPQISFATLILLIGFSFLVRGIIEVAVGLFEEGPSWYRVAMIILGLLVALAGILILFQPVAGGVAFVWILGVYALISGPIMIAVAAEMNRKDKKDDDKK